MPRNEALLGVSSLVRTFCQNEASCHGVSEVKELVKKLESFLGDGCQAQDQLEEDLVVLSLKGLRNIGHVDRAEPTIIRCYEDDMNTAPVRLAAMDTARELTCTSGGFQESLLNMFSDPGKDSELRVAAYLALMACPDKGTVAVIRNLLIQEEVNQGNKCSL